MSRNLGESLHISNVIFSTKINNSDDTCSFIPVSQKGIAKEEQRKGKKRGERKRRRRARRRRKKGVNKERGRFICYI